MVQDRLSPVLMCYIIEHDHNIIIEIMNKKERVKIVAPSSLLEIPLHKYQTYLSRVTVEEGEVLDAEYLMRTVMTLFLNIRGEDYLRIPMKDTRVIVGDLVQLLNTIPKLEKTFKWRGVEYGFIPNLDEVTTGEFIDMDNNTGVENFHLLMSILFRPIVKREGDNYTIEEYTGTHENFRMLPLHYAIAAQGFFLTLGEQLLKTTLKSSVEKEQLQMKKQDLEKSGVGQQ